MPLSRRDFFLLCLLTIFWGLNWPIMKLGVIDYPPLAFRSMSMLGAIAGIGAWCAPDCGEVTAISNIREIRTGFT